MDRNSGDTSAARACRLCGGVANLVYAGHWGFQAPGRYDLYECLQCETSFADPMVVDPAIYELVYSKSAELPGYERYGRYRRLLKSSADPLGDLCQLEDVYWGVREALQALAKGRERPLEILEVGSGFGYLTYALRRAGYECTGTDISKSAVDAAVQDFGNHYRVAELTEMAAASSARVDVVVATELIEHLPDPKAFLALAASLLQPDGALIVTTPNRGIYPAHHAWDTDPPPVHLWWLSRTSLRYLAWTLGMSLEFIDFSGFYGRRHAERVRKATKPQSFDAEGNVTFKDSALKTLARRAMSVAPGLFRPLGKLFLASLSFSRNRDALFKDSLSLCAILRPRGAAERPLSPPRPA